MNRKDEIFSINQGNLREWKNEKLSLVWDGITQELDVSVDPLCCDDWHS